ncbi:MAG TPA: hypothetical protein VKK79_18955 [Candidatus Lokiarchaeia archaeon]|nr:hypothetical protein [Candidatus Lokiarchaeia archaeon]
MASDDSRNVVAQEPQIAPEKITFTTFHPEWETVEKAFYVKRILIVIFAIILIYLFVWFGFTWPQSKMAATFASQYPFHIIEFSLWCFSMIFMFEIGLIANHKIRTTKIKFKMSKNEEMRLSLFFNRSFFALFIMFFAFNVLKLVIRFIFYWNFWDSNIFHAMLDYPTNYIPVWITNALYVLLGFTGYAQFVYAFEKVVMGRRIPYLWIIPVIGMAIMLFAPWDIVVFQIQFTSQLIWTMQMYYFGQWLAMFGGIAVPILYFVMGQRFSYGHPQTAQDCYRKGIGFTFAAIGGVFDVNQELVLAQYGGILLFFDAFVWIFLASVLTIIGVLLIRSAYRPKG